MIEQSSQLRLALREKLTGLRDPSGYGLLRLRLGLAVLLRHLLPLGEVAVPLGCAEIMILRLRFSGLPLQGSDQPPVCHPESE